MNKRIANKKLKQHCWFEKWQFGVGRLSKRKNSSAREAHLFVKAVQTLHLKYRFLNGGVLIEVLNPENIKWKW